MNNIYNTKLEKVSKIESSYFYTRGFKKGKRIDVSKFGKGAYCVPEMAKMLKILNRLVATENGSLYITDLFRNWDTQQKAREDFLLGKKKAFVAKPGYSFHNAGRAIDIDVNNLNFRGIEKENWLQKLWDLAKPLGFHPIISIPDLSMSECWHFDFPGQFLYTYKKSYTECCKACVLDIGEWKDEKDEYKLKVMFIQSQLVRLDYTDDIGKIDGIFGPKTKGCLSSLQINASENIDKIIKKIKEF